MSKVLITGGAGFIGSRIASACVKSGLEVRVFDLVKSRVEGVSESMTGSILDPYEISLAARGCDMIVHAAAALGVQRTETRRLECLYINIQGTVNVLEAAVKERAKKILLTSSSEVYGDQDLDVFKEDSPVSPKSNYAITKLMGEEYLRAYRESYGIDYTVVRFFNVYGEEQISQFVVSKFADSILRGEAPTVYGDGSQIRSFCHVDDAAEGAVSALIAPKTNSGIFNIGNDQEPISMQDLARRMIRVSGARLEPKFVPFESSDREEKRDIRRRVPSIAKARAVFGYRPHIALDEGLRRVFEARSQNSRSPERAAAVR